MKSIEFKQEKGGTSTKKKKRLRKKNGGTIRATIYSFAASVGLRRTLSPPKRLI